MYTDGEIISELAAMFKDVKPDADYLERDPDTKADVEEIEKLLKDNAAPASEKIKLLHAFNTDWFPDEADDEEQDDYQNLLDAAESFI